MVSKTQYFCKITVSLHITAVPKEELGKREENTVKYPPNIFPGLNM